jgi:hypothetical protein
MGQTGEVTEARAGIFNVNLAPLQGFARVDRLDQSNSVLRGFELVGQSEDEASPLLRGNVSSPRRLEGSSSSFDGEVDVLSACGVKLQARRG